MSFYRYLHDLAHNPKATKDDRATARRMLNQMVSNIAFGE